jgi:hypothetical protein
MDLTARFCPDRGNAFDGRIRPASPNAAPVRPIQSDIAQHKLRQLRQKPKNLNFYWLELELWRVGAQNLGGSRMPAAHDAVKWPIFSAAPEALSNHAFLQDFALFSPSAIDRDQGDVT